MENNLSYSYEIINLQLAVIEVEKNNSVIGYCSLKLLFL